MGCRDRELAEDDRVIEVDQAIECLPCDVDGRGGIAAPQGDLRPERGQVDAELGILDVRRFCLGDVQVAAGQCQVPGPDAEVRERDVKVERADPGPDVGRLSFEQVGGLVVPSELDQHRRRVDGQEDPEPEFAPVQSDDIRPGEGDGEGFLDETTHLEHGAEVGVAAGDLHRIARRRCDPEGLTEQHDASGDVAQRCPVDAEHLERARLDPLGADSSRLVDGSQGEWNGLARASREHQVRRQPCQHARLVRGRRATLEQLDGLFEELDGLDRLAGQ